MATLIGFSQLTSAPASTNLHNVTYVARVDGVAPGGQARFLIHDDNQTSDVGLSAVPGTAFEANTVLADPNKAGMQVSIPWPYSANVHCEIDIDDTVFRQVDQFVSSTHPGANGVLPCGAPLINA